MYKLLILVVCCLVVIRTPLLLQQFDLSYLVQTDSFSGSSKVVPLLMLVDNNEQASRRNNSTDGCTRVLVGIFPTFSDVSTADHRRRNWEILLRIPPVQQEMSSSSKSHPESLRCGLNFVFPRENQSTLAWFNSSLQAYTSVDYLACMEDDTSIHQFRLDEEFAHAYKEHADYIGRPESSSTSTSSNDVFQHMSAGFYALSTRLTKGVLLAASADIKSTSYSERTNAQDEARLIGKLAQRAGLNRECCQLRQHSDNSASSPCLGKCYALFGSDDSHLLERTRSTPLHDKSSVIETHPKPQVTLRPDDGDVASTRLLMPMADTVWATWFGPPMSGNRSVVYENLRRNIGAPLKLLTTKTLCAYNVTSSPMHSLIGKRGLSAIHLGDYLRAYMMHHHGGGYHDVKAHEEGQGWTPYFEKMNANHNIWLYGIQEKYRRWIACHDTNVIHCRNTSLPPLESTEKSQSPECCGVVQDHWKHLVSNGAYIMRPGTLLTAQWLITVEAHLDAKMESILQNPAPRARCCLGAQETKGYPVRWAELHGEAFHPTQYEYRDHIRTGLSSFLKTPYTGKGEGMTIDNLFASSCLSPFPRKSLIHRTASNVRMKYEVKTGQ